MRNERYRKNAISVRERHNERKNEVYSNPDVLLEYSHNNVIFKACEAATYAQQFDRMVEKGIVSTRGLKPDAYIFDELVFDVNTDYFETHGGYEYAKQFYAEVYELAKEITGGEQYIISAVMHATSATGKPVTGWEGMCSTITFMLSICRWWKSRSAGPSGARTRHCGAPCGRQSCR